MRSETTQNLLTTCCLLSETWATTWASICTTYFPIWTGFLRTWVQWVTSTGRDSIKNWKRWLLTTNLKRDLPAAEHSTTSKKRKSKPWTLNNGEATCNLRVLTFINARHSVYSNRCFYQIISICCLQNIFSLKNVFRMLKKSADNATKM